MSDYMYDDREWWRASPSVLAVPMAPPTALPIERIHRGEPAADEHGLSDLFTRGTGRHRGPLDLAWIQAVIASWWTT